MTALAALATGVFAYVAVGVAVGHPVRIVPVRPRRRGGHTAGAEEWLLQAGAAVTPFQFWAASGMVALATFLVVCLLTGAPLVALAPALVAGLAPRAYYARRREARLREVQAAWPDALRDVVASLAAGRSLGAALGELARTGPAPLRPAFERYSATTRMVGAGPALELVKASLADPTSDRVVEVLMLASERGGPIVTAVLEDLVIATTRDLKVADEIDTEGLEMRINACAVLVLPWLVLVALTVRGGAFREFYQSSAGFVVVAVGAALSAVGYAWITCLARSLEERRVFGAVRATGRDGRRGMSGIVTAVAVAGAGVAAAGCAGLIVRPTGRLAPRVRPYSLLARARLRGDADVLAVAGTPNTGTGVARVLVPPVRGPLTSGLGALVERRSDDQLALALLRQAGRSTTPADQRHATALAVVRDAAAGATLGALALHSALLALGLALVGAIAGASRVRARLDRDVRDRAERMRLELYTVNQLLAMHVRAGAGPIQAVQRVVDRGTGGVVDELASVLLAVRRGASEPQAFRDAAEWTPEPAAARTYKLFAAGAERGVDLAGGLRALSEDLRDARREEVRQTATKRRAAMLVPTIVVLAPVMLLFIAAPLPSVVFGV